MKKIFSIIAVLFFITTGLIAQDLNKGQMALRLEVVKYLSSEGFQPKIDKDGDVFFIHNDYNYYVVIQKQWTEPYLVWLYLPLKYSDTIYTKQNVESCINAVAKYKTVKLVCTKEIYRFSSELLCADIEVLKTSFRSALEQIDGAFNDVVTILSADLGGVDITNDKEAVFEKAISHYRNDEYKKSFPLFKYLAENGYEAAYGYLGLAYEFGEGVSKDEELMKSYYHKAIDAGYYWCAYRLGRYYYLNDNYAEAMNNYIKCGANENGFRSEALYLVGNMHEKGIGTETNVSQAISFYRKSVLYATDLECEARLALMRLGETIEREEDFVDATKSMLIGLTPQEMYKIGEEYEIGLNNRYVSLTKAYAFYKAAADKGDPKALSKMGEIYISKFYPFNDKAKSDKYYSKAIKIYKKNVKTDGNACYQLGYMYYNGYGVEKDIEQAKIYYKSGALLGNIHAAWRTGLIYKDEMEYTEAFKFFLKAADGGQGMAMYELAKLYEYGLGTPHNKDKAIEWYQKCAESTYVARKDAKKDLQRLTDNDGKE